MHRDAERDGKEGWPAGRTRLGDAVHEADWSATRLGPVARWPAALRLAAGMVLDSHFAQNLMWGPDFVQIYNDAFVRILGTRHPGALGQPAAECWPELWDAIGPGIRDVMASGVAVSHENAPYTIVSDGVPEERFFTFSWSPVRDLDGRVVGVLNTVIELSSTVRTVQEGERRLSEALGEIGRWQAVFDQAPAFMAISEGPEHRIAATNAAYRALVGNRPLAGLATREALPELVPQGFVTQLDSVWRSGAPYSATGARVLLQRTPGDPMEERHVDFLFQPLKDRDGRTTGILLVGVDASERHVAQRARDDAEERARIALKAASMGVWRHDRATDLIELDAIACEHYGVDEPILPLATVLARVEPGDRDTLRLGMAASRDPAVRAPVSIEYRVADRHGRMRWISVSGRVLFDGAPGRERWVRAIGTSRDVTAQKLAEQALRASEADFRTLFELSAVGVGQADPATGRFARVNRRLCELTGYTEAELLERRVAHLTHPEDRAAELATLAPLYRGERDEWAIEKRYVRADGSTIWVHVAGRFLRDDRGRLLHTIAGVIDITARRQAEAALREAEQALRENDRLKDEYLMTLAHELRGPLAPIRTALGVFDREALSGAGRHALAMSQRQLRQLTRLVDDLLEASRAMRGTIEIRPEPILVQHVVHAAAETVASLLDERRQRVAFGMPETPLRIVADPVRLAQVVENLLTNASKYSDPGSPIDVRVAPDVDGDGVAIEIADRGAGIAPEQLPRLFTLFAQLDTTLDRSRGGLGIGLHLVRRLVELHGGTVSAHSDGPGRGATFRVVLPSRPGRPPAGTDVPAGPAEERGGPR
jgi:PAS domain S-box-containing protein